jgi:hypothetical protein
MIRLHFFILIVVYIWWPTRSGDGYIRKEDNRWVIGTAMVENDQLNRGSVPTSFKNKASQREYVRRACLGRNRLTANGVYLPGAMASGLWFVRKAIRWRKVSWS